MFLTVEEFESLTAGRGKADFLGDLVFIDRLVNLTVVDDASIRRARLGPGDDRDRVGARKKGKLADALGSNEGPAAPRRLGGAVFAFGVADLEKLVLEIVTAHAGAVVPDGHDSPSAINIDPDIGRVGVPGVGDCFADDRDEVAVELAPQMVQNSQRKLKS